MKRTRRQRLLAAARVLEATAPPPVLELDLSSGDNADWLHIVTARREGRPWPPEAGTKGKGGKKSKAAPKA